MIQLVSWNVNGLRACVKKGFLDVMEQLDADIFCIQETKLQEGQIDLELPDYYQYWNYAGQGRRMRDGALTISVFPRALKNAWQRQLSTQIFMVLTTARLDCIWNNRKD